MRFISHTETDLAQMLALLGLKDTAELFQDIPADLLCPFPELLPKGSSELELRAHLVNLAHQNRLPRLSFLGGGAYSHFIPASVDAVISRSEFYTSYTPYQPEISQGLLQAAWEFQSMISSLLAMDVANSSLYDGATSTAEGMLLACRFTGRKEVLVSRALNPSFREVLKTYAQAAEINIQEIPFQNGATSLSTLKHLLNDQTAAVIVQSPNFFGIIEELDPLVQTAHRAGALFICCFTEALAFGLLKPPGSSDCDLVCGEGQSLGIPLNFGGPGLGLFAAKSLYLRKMPGRLVGRTKDRQGQTGFVLTLQAREQHILREEATSNICSNHFLAALAAAVYLATLGKNGLADCARLNYCQAHYTQENLLKMGLGHIRAPFGDKPFFNEFVIHLPKAEAKSAHLLNEGIVPGLLLEKDYPELPDCLLVCCTELHSQSDLDLLIKRLTR